MSNLDDDVFRMPLDFVPWRSGMWLDGVHADKLGSAAFMVDALLLTTMVLLLIVLASVIVGRIFIFRGEMLNGWLWSDHLSCRSLAWLELWGRGVSYPGDALPVRQKRLGKWRKQDDMVKLEPGWTFLSAEESHDYSEKLMRDQYGVVDCMSGEPCGRQIWVKQTASSLQTSPSFDPSKNPNSSDLLYREQRLKAWKGRKPEEEHLEPKTAKEAAEKGIRFYSMLQNEDGHWGGDYAGPMFLMPGLIFTCYITDVDLGAKKEAMIAYLCNHQQEDGGWGTHIESPSTMFGSVLSYVSLRLLGLTSSHPAILKGRKFIQENGGAVTSPSWAKFWLSVLGVHEWEGVNSIPAEMWLLPLWFPFHPGKLWCHCRMVYLPMCFLYCTRFTNPKKLNDPLLEQIRKEIYVSSYDTVKWDKERHSICPLDEYSPVTRLQKFLHDVLSWYETHLSLHFLPPFSWLRRAGVRTAMEYIEAEDLQTNFIDIGPVNKVLNMLCVWADAGCKTTPNFFRHIPRLDDYLWVAEDGMKMQGYNGSQCWDTSFAVQAIVESGLANKFPDTCIKAYDYLARTQILSTPMSQSSRAYEYESVEKRKRFFRHVSKGGWPFSTSAHGWPISDCSSEGLKAVLSLHSLAGLSEQTISGTISDERLFDCAHLLLTYQNADGGWATYENNRGFGFYEWMNPSEVFGDIMIDYSYVECSSASMTALAAFKKFYPHHRSKEIDGALKRGARFIRSIQRPDGSWYGSWGVCFTYGTWFGIEALMTAGCSSDDGSVRLAVNFLLSKQNNNGGWGESYRSCVDKVYDGSEEACYGRGGSGVVQTAWALLGLMAAKVHLPEEVHAVEQGIKYLMSMQTPAGDWEQEGITGVFNRSCGITYTQYRNIFPLWALGRYDEWKQHATK